MCGSLAAELSNDDSKLLEYLTPNSCDNSVFKINIVEDGTICLDPISDSCVDVTTFERLSTRLRQSISHGARAYGMMY